MINRYLQRSLHRIGRGSLRVTGADGSTSRFGDGTAPEVSIRFVDAGAELALALDPALKLGELYMDGRLVIEHGSCYQLIEIFKRSARKAASAGSSGPSRLGT